MANVISPAADPIWSRTVLFVRGHRWANRPEPDQIMDHLWRQRPIITGNSELLRSKAGQQAAILLVNLMARICPGILIDVPRNIPLIVPKNPLINHDYLFDALAAVPLQIWGEGCKGPAHDSELALSIGSWPASRRKPHIVVRFGSWWGGAFENDARADNDDSDSSGPGSLVAACLGAAAAYKTIVRRLAAK